MTATPIEVSCAECTGGLAPERCPGCGIPPNASEDTERVYVGPLRGRWHTDCLAKQARHTDNERIAR